MRQLRGIAEGGQAADVAKDGRKLGPRQHLVVGGEVVVVGSAPLEHLINEVREKRGLTYGVSSGLRTYKRAALLVVSTASANERVADAIRVVRAEIARMRTEGVTEQELADAKTYLSGALALSLDSSGSVASLMHSLQVDGLSPDHLVRREALIAFCHTLMNSAPFLYVD